MAKEGFSLGVLLVAKSHKISKIAGKLFQSVLRARVRVYVLRTLNINQNLSRFGATCPIPLDDPLSLCLITSVATISSFQWIGENKGSLGWIRHRVSKPRELGDKPQRRLGKRVLSPCLLCIILLIDYSYTQPRQREAFSMGQDRLPP